MDPMAGRQANDSDWSDLIARHPRGGVYAVLTTGIACRFGCPSHPPLRKNLRLFDTLSDAQAAGFRPCKRCHP